MAINVQLQAKLLDIKNLLNLEATTYNQKQAGLFYHVTELHCVGICTGLSTKFITLSDEFKSLFTKKCKIQF